MLSLDEIVAASEQLTACGHWYLDLADDTLIWSDQIYLIHGLSPQDPQPDRESAIAYYLEPDQEQIRRQLEQTRSHGAALDVVGRIQRPDGQIRYIRSQGKRIDGRGDHPGYILGVFRDITEEWLAHRHQRRVAQALASTAEGIIMTDPDGGLIWCNEALERLSGYSMDELRGYKPGALFQGPQTDLETVAYMARQLEAEESFIVEVLNYNRHGQPYWVRLSVHPDRSDDGTLLGFTAIQSDITKEKTSREKLEREVERRIQLEAELRYLSNYDALSGMPNRRYFFEQADSELGRCRRHARTLSLILLDLDDFKSINDTRGHAAGDAVIRAVGDFCARTLREYDFAARIGGEEFTVLLPETDLDGASIIAERLRCELETIAIVEGEDSIYVTASFGVTEVYPETDSVETFLARADRALYSAKRSGRNRVRTEPSKSG